MVIKKKASTKDEGLNGNHFHVVDRIDIPHGRKGKHKDIVTRILEDLANLKEGTAMRIRLDELPDTKAKIRAALSRAVHLRNMKVITSTDDDHLYIWQAPKNK